jgi:hypothetical protein
MKKIIISFVFITYSIMLFSQSGRLSLYNSLGQLRADTTLKISQKQLTKWINVEESLIETIINKLNYSQMAIENDIKGQMIISFDIDSTKSMFDYKLLKKVGGGLEETLRLFLIECDLIKKLSPTDNSVYKYFLALNFDLVDANNYIRTTGAIPITKVKWTYIQQ